MMDNGIRFAVFNCLHRFTIMWSYYALFFTNDRVVAAVTMTQKEYTKGAEKALLSPAMLAGAAITPLGAGVAVGAISFYSSKAQLAQSLNNASELARKGIDEIAGASKDNFVFRYSDMDGVVVEKGGGMKHTTILISTRGKEYKFAIESGNGMPPYALPDDLQNGYINSMREVLGSKLTVR